MAAFGIVWLLYINGAFLPKWIDWKNREMSCDEGITIVLSNRHISVSTEEKDADNNADETEIIWESPDGLLVQDYIWEDITGDGNRELVILGWRRGRFGKDRPFWVKKNDMSWSQHIGVYTYSKETNVIKSIWMASDVGDYCSQWKYDIAHKHLLIQNNKGDVCSWRWSGFGFEKADDTVSFAVAGDNLIHDNIYKYGLEEKSGDFTYMYRGVKDRLNEADVRVINLETILVDDESLYGGYPSFGTPIEVGEALSQSGFQIFTCATNHALDKGMTGIDTTVSFCRDNGITYLGIQGSDDVNTYKPYEVYYKKGYSFALFNYTMGLSNTNGKYPDGIPENAVHLMDNEEKIKEDLKRARTECDGVVVFVHWGTENTTTVDEFQKKWASIFNECNVDVVVGTHPHVIQEVTTLTDEDGFDTIIYYSIGNFISAQREEANQTGAIALFSFGMTMDGMRIEQYSTEKVTTEHTGGYYTVHYLDETSVRGESD